MLTRRHASRSAQGTMARAAYAGGDLYKVRVASDGSIVKVVVRALRAVIDAVRTCASRCGKRRRGGGDVSARRCQLERSAFDVGCRQCYLKQERQLALTDCNVAEQRNTAGFSLRALVLLPLSHHAHRRVEWHCSCQASDTMKSRTDTSS